MGELEEHVAGLHGCLLRVFNADEWMGNGGCDQCYSTVQRQTEACTALLIERTDTWKWV